MLNPFDLSVGLRRALYLLGVGIISSGGITTVWLARPKNAAADLAGGIISGGLAAVICYTISWGWVAVSIAGTPYGIWLGMASALLIMGSICVFEALAAGLLLRRHLRVVSMIGPYIEVTIPSVLALIFLSSALFQLASATRESRGWHIFMVPVLVLASIGVLNRWHWSVRALLHTIWALTLYFLATPKL
jgi:hypothetical protein